MNFAAGSGGLMLVALAVVWFMVFVPSWAKRGEEKDQATRERIERRAALNESLVAQGASRARNLKRTFIALASVSAAATLVAVFQGAPIVAGSTLLVMVVLVFASRRASKQLDAVVLSGANRRTKIPAGLVGQRVEKQKVSEVEPDRSWKPIEVPAQTYLSQIGTLESPTLADVVEIEFPSELPSETLDEILRRRRAN